MARITLMSISASWASNSFSSNAMIVRFIATIYGIYDIKHLYVLFTSGT